MFWCLCNFTCLFGFLEAVLAVGKWVYSSDSIGLTIRLNSIGLKHEWESLVRALSAGRLADNVQVREKNYPGESWIFWWTLCLWEKQTLHVQRFSCGPLSGRQEGWEDAVQLWKFAEENLFLCCGGAFMHPVSKTKLVPYPSLVLFIHRWDEFFCSNKVFFPL